MKATKPPKLRLFDAVVCLAIAEKNHPKSIDLKRITKRLMTLLPRAQRGALAPIIASSNPHQVIRHMLDNLDS